MKVTKQHKVLAGLIVMGALAVGSDRIFFLKESTPAMTPTEYAIAAPKAQATPTTGPALPVSSIAQRLRQAASITPDNSTSHDAFSLGSAWPVTVKEVAQDTSVQRFSQAHRLTGVLTSNGRSVAMIDGKIVALGQTVDGFRLTSIEHRSVTFEAGADRVDLNMVEHSNAVAGAQ